MLRQLQPEILDRLPTDDPEAVRSRRDLARINALMGNWRWLARGLQQHLAPGDRVLEIGAGRGEFLAWWGRHDGATTRKGTLHGLDLAPPPRSWSPEREWLQTDLAQFDGYARFDVVVANLVLHHCDDAGLAALGRRLADGPRVVLACEPARRRLHVWQARALALLGVNRVTRHDAPASVCAGFRGNELPALVGLLAPRWSTVVTTTWRGAYRLIAMKVNGARP